MKSRVGLLAAAIVVLFAAGGCDILVKEWVKSITNPRVKVSIQDNDKTGLGSEVMNDMVRALRNIEGVTIAKTNAVFQFTVIIYPTCDGKRFAASAVIEEHFSIGEPVLHKHVLYLGPREKVRGCCEKLVEIFHSEVLAPLREDLQLTPPSRKAPAGLENHASRHYVSAHLGAPRFENKPGRASNDVRRGK